MTSAKGRGPIVGCGVLGRATVVAALGCVVVAGTGACPEGTEGVVGVVGDDRVSGAVAVCAGKPLEVGTVLLPELVSLVIDTAAVATGLGGIIAHDDSHPTSVKI